MDFDANIGDKYVKEHSLIGMKNRWRVTHERVAIFDACYEQAVKGRYSKAQKYCYNI
jgi:hypothetical protein